MYEEGPQRCINRGAFLKIQGYPSGRETEGMTIHVVNGQKAERRTNNSGNAVLTLLKVLYVLQQAIG